MWLALLAVGAASASQTNTIYPNDSQMVQTPVGPVTVRSIRGVCASEFVFIGHIESVDTQWSVSSTGKPSVHSDITFAPDRALYGQVPATVSFTVPGGLYDGVVWPTPTRLPVPASGRRYALAYSTLKSALPGRPVGSVSVNKTAWIPPGAVLPSAEDLQAQLDDLCATHDLPRYHDVVPGSSPSAGGN